MSTAFVPGLQAVRNAKLIKLRELPIVGEILVQPGAVVESGDIVARAALPGELYISRIPEKMGLLVDEVLAGLQVKEGDTVSEGDLLCIHKGFFGLLTSRFNAPVSGTVELITKKTGHLAIRLAPKVMNVSAYLSGTVKNIEPGKAVLIEAQGTLVQGIFGVGGERNGTIRILEIPADQEIGAAQVPADIKGAILVGGARPTIEGLRKAAELGAVGLITGSIDDRTLAQYLGFDLGIALTGDEAVPMTVIILEGFGNLAISAQTLTLLTEANGKQAAINGATQVRAGAVRPEVLIPSSSANATTQQGVMNRALEPEQQQGLVVGRKVRLIRVPYFGLLGEVVGLPDAPEQIETGAVTRVARVRLLTKNSRDESMPGMVAGIVSVPRANLELV